MHTTDECKWHITDWNGMEVLVVFLMLCSFEVLRLCCGRQNEIRMTKEICVISNGFCRVNNGENK